MEEKRKRGRPKSGGVVSEEAKTARRLATALHQKARAEKVIAEALTELTKNKQNE